MLGPSFWSSDLRLWVTHSVSQGLLKEEKSLEYLKQRAWCRKLVTQGKAELKCPIARQGGNPEVNTPSLGQTEDAKGEGNLRGTRSVPLLIRCSQGQKGSRRNSLASPFFLPLSPANICLATPSLGTGSPGSLLPQYRGIHPRTDGSRTSTNIAALADARPSPRMFRGELPLKGHVPHQDDQGLCPAHDTPLKASRFALDCSLCLDRVALLCYLQ